MESSSEEVPTRVETVTKPAIDGQKKRSWEEATNEFRRVTDRLGHEIDHGVLETVVALNVLGVNTVQSCEGHLDHGTGAPYIDVAAKDTLELEDRFYEMFGKEEMREEMERISGEIARRNLTERAKLMELLGAFYDNRKAPYDRRLIVQSMGLGRSRIESQGADLQEIAPPAVKQQRLGEYQEEMRAFTTFLKQRYFSR